MHRVHKLKGILPVQDAGTQSSSDTNRIAHFLASLCQSTALLTKYGIFFTVQKYSSQFSLLPQKEKLQTYIQTKIIYYSLTSK